jgi:ORMDL family
MIHVVLVAAGKVIIDVIPGVTQNVSWTAVNLTYLAVRPLPYYPKASHPPSPTDPTIH